MEVFDNKFVYEETRARECIFSLKGTVAAAADFIDLPRLEVSAGVCFTLQGAFIWSTWVVATDKLHSLILSVSNAVFHSAKRVLRRAVAGVRHFVCSNQRARRRVVPMVPMALRL